MRTPLPIVTMMPALAAGCSETPVSPTTTSTAPPEFASQVATGGTATRVVTLPNSSTIRVTLTSVAPAAQLGLGVGIRRSSGTGCSLARSLTTGPSDTPQISVAADAGEFCVQVYDPGTLTEQVSSR
jgi:hypothetical protein